MAFNQIIMALVSVFRASGIEQASKALRGLDGDFKNVAISAGKAALNFAAAGSIQKLTQYIDDAVTITQKYERNILALNQTFEDQAGRMRQFTQDAVDMGISQSQAAQASVFLGSVLKQYGLETSVSATETQKLIGLSQDLATTYGYDLQEALLAMTALFRGEYDPIEKFGVAMKQNEINALLAQRGQDKLTGTMLFQAQVQARLDLLYQRSADSMGAFTRATDTLYAAQSRLNAAIENQQIAFGEPLQKPITALTNSSAKLASETTPAFATFGETIANIGEAIVPLVELINNGLANAINGLAKPLETVNLFFDVFAERIKAANKELERNTALGKDSAIVKLGNDLADTAGADVMFTNALEWMNEQLTNSLYMFRAVSDEYSSFDNGAKAVSVSIRRAWAEQRRLNQEQEAALVAGTAFENMLRSIGTEADTTAGKTSTMTSVFAEIDNAIAQSNAKTALEDLGLSAGLIEKVLTDPNWEQIFGDISRLARLTAIDIASISSVTAAAGYSNEIAAIRERLANAFTVDNGKGGAGSAKNYVEDFFAGLRDEVAKQTASNKLKSYGATQGLIDSILGGDGWEQVFNKVIANGKSGIKSLQDQFNKTKSGIAEINALQEEATALAEAQKNAAEDAKKAIQDQQDAYDELVKSLAEFRNSMKDLVSLDVLGTIEVQIGKFEQAVVSKLDSIKSSLKNALDNKQIFQGAYNQLIAYADKEMAALQAIQRQRDALAAKYDFVSNLLSSYREAFTSSLSLTSLISQIEAKTKQVTVTETTTGISNITNSLKQLQVVIKREYTDTINTTSSASETLVENFRNMADKARAFGENLKKLKQMGLDPQLFSQLVQAGVEAGGQTAQALVDGGQATITEVSSLFEEIGSVGVAVGEYVAEDFYATGETFGSSLLDGIRSQQTNLEQLARDMATSFQDNFDVKVGNATKQVAEVAQLDNSLNNLKAQLDKQRELQAAKQAALDALPENRYSGTKAAYNKSLGIYADTIASLEAQIAGVQNSISNTQIGKLASGGIALGPALSLVGEAGPEAIIPLDKLKNMNTQPTTVNNYFTINASGAIEGQRVVDALKRYQQQNGLVTNALVGFGS